MKQLFIISILVNALSIPHVVTKPTIFVRWAHKPADSAQQLSDNHLKADAIFKTFDMSFLKKHELPDSISYRYDRSTSVDTRTLKGLIMQLIEEVKQNKKNFTHFHVLHDTTFFSTMQAGCLVVKFNDYPFVVKLFMENPVSFVSPFAKGWEPWIHFIMGGTSRHLLGGTRIKNCLAVAATLARHPKWASLVEFPRKWFFVPENTPFLEITGKNMTARQSTFSIAIPGIYCIIADAIDIQRMFSFLRSADRTTALDLCNSVELALDPNTENFAVDKQTGNIVALDTEHYPSMINLTVTSFANYPFLYAYLVAKALKNIFFP